MRMLLSINPEHVENILNGTKKFEFRKVRSRQPIRHIIIYSTAPVGRVVGEVEVVGTVDGAPADVWSATKDHSGISRHFFDVYFQGRARAIAYELGEVLVYKHPKPLAEFGLRAAPQSFAYVT